MMTRLDVPYDCIWGRVDNSIKNYHRLDLKVHPSREHMRKILQYTPGLFCLFKTKTDKLTVRYKVHFSSTHYVLPIKSKVEPVILGLDKQGLWHMLNYIHVFDTQLEGKIQPDPPDRLRPGLRTGHPRHPAPPQSRRQNSVSPQPSHM